MKSDNFKEILEPILYLLDIDYKLHVEPHVLNALYDKYKDSILTNKNSTDEIRKWIGDTITKCLFKINKKYYKGLKKIYTDDGIYTILFDHLYTKIIENVTTT